uniref:Uncharacterized protein n=1 Tax=Glossina austeni TaxID=7395 RepID=A0A1A9UGH6_GLOAU
MAYGVKLTFISQYILILLIHIITMLTGLRVTLNQSNLPNTCFTNYALCLQKYQPSEISLITPVIIFPKNKTKTDPLASVDTNTKIASTNEALLNILNQKSDINE